MILEVLVLIIAFPVGFLIAWLARDELVKGREWFRILIIAGFILSMGFYFMDYNHIAFTSIFMVIVSFISYMKSFDKKWCRKRLK